MVWCMGFNIMLQTHNAFSFHDCCCHLCPSFSSDIWWIKLGFLLLFFLYTGVNICKFGLVTSVLCLIVALLFLMYKILLCIVLQPTRYMLLMQVTLQCRYVLVVMLVTFYACDLNLYSFIYSSLFAPRKEKPLVFKVCMLDVKCLIILMIWSSYAM